MQIKNKDKNKSKKLRALRVTYDDVKRILKTNLINIYKLTFNYSVKLININ